MEAAPSFASSVGEKSSAESATRQLNDVPFTDSAPQSPSAAAEAEGKNAFGDVFRNYENSARQSAVETNYYKNHTMMTVEFVRERMAKWLKLDHGEFTVMEAIEMLDDLVDDSDPDNELPNSIHDYQTAERIRKAFPGEEYDWFHLTGLLHDLGKVLSIWGEPQWSVVGDTFPVGCAHAPECVFPQFFSENPDASHPVYSTKNGMYKEGCGIRNLLMGWGHDEYMYWMLKKNGCTLPEEALCAIRYHSFYPWHTSGAYSHFEEPSDAILKKWVLEFNRFDLYSKGDEVPDVPSLRSYYEGLLKKYNIAGKLKW